MLNLNLPKKASPEIKNSKERLRHLFALYPARYRKKTVLWIGILDMIDGLDYHCDTIAALEHKLQEKYSPRLDACLDRVNSRPYSHELTAYLNRIGHLYYFFTSRWLHDILCSKKCANKKDKDRIKEECIVNTIISQAPILLCLLILRHKHSAHRVSDSPIKTDTDYDIDLKGHGINVAGLHPVIHGDANCNIKLKTSINVNKKSRNPFLNQNHPTQIETLEFFDQSAERILIQYSPTTWHEKLINEIIKLVTLFLTKEN